MVFWVVQHYMATQPRRPPLETKSTFFPLYFNDSITSLIQNIIFYVCIKAMFSLRKTKINHKKYSTFLKCTLIRNYFYVDELTCDFA